MITGEIKTQIDRIWGLILVRRHLEPVGGDGADHLPAVPPSARRSPHAGGEQSPSAQEADGAAGLPEGNDAKGRSYEDFRWSRFKHFAPAEMFMVVGEHVFPYLRTDLARQLGGADSTYAHHMKGRAFHHTDTGAVGEGGGPAR